MTLLWKMAVTLLAMLSPFIVVSMLVALLLATWQPGVIAKHAKGKLSIRWTRFIVGMTLVLVLTLIAALRRL